MAYQLRSTVTGAGASGCYLYREDAEAALGSSELLRIVSDWATGKATFPDLRFGDRQSGQRPPVMDVTADRENTQLVNVLVRRYLAAR
ncbi:MAG: hypothetical protein ACJ72N_19840 [Labedaea sp.]